MGKLCIHRCIIMRPSLKIHLSRKLLDHGFFWAGISGNRRHKWLIYHLLARFIQVVLGILCVGYTDQFKYLFRLCAVNLSSSGNIKQRHKSNELQLHAI